MKERDHLGDKRFHKRIILKCILKGTDSEVVHWIQMAQDRVQ
jgi:hypothetical protein